MSYSRFMRGSTLLENNATTPGAHLTDKEKKIFIQILDICRKYGLDFYDTIVQKVRYDEMSEIAAYGGFIHRYPHWSWGMAYEELQRGYEYNQHKIYEMVTNCSPCPIYILASNSLSDNVCVVFHATGHNHFFKNNIFFTPTDENMANKLASNGDRISKYISRWGKEKVTAFIDHVLRIQTLIDPSKAWTQREIKEPIIKDSREYFQPRRLKVDKDRSHMNEWINPKEYMDAEYELIKEKELVRELDLFQNSDKDIFGFLRDNAKLKTWQADIMAMLYEESMYFAPQRCTKTLNEGFACGKFDTLVLTNKGYVKLGEIVEKRLKLQAHDGFQLHNVSNWFKFENRECAKITTKKGYIFEGTLTHRLLNNNLEWKRIDELNVGDKLLLNRDNMQWSGQYQRIYHVIKKFTKSLSEIARTHNVSRDVIYRNDFSSFSQSLLQDLKLHEKEKNTLKIDENYGRRTQITLPKTMDEDFAKFCGYMTGDGHINNDGKTMGLTSGDVEQIDDYIALAKKLFNLGCNKKWDDSSKNGRWRAIIHSRHLVDLMVYLGYTKGYSARIKQIPEMVLKSPKSVISAYLKAYFDCDAGVYNKNGIILSSSSPKLVEQVQIVLLNYGILSTRYLRKEDNYHVYISLDSASRFYHEIGFGLARKQNALNAYIHRKRLNYETPNIDEIESIEYTGKQTVYDITVDETHRYSAQGFINHNSHCDYEFLARQGHVSLGQETHDMGIFEYAIHKTAVLGGKYSSNPYKTGFTLLLDIEERWNKGQFGTEWEECKNLKQKEEWDTKTMMGKDKVFQVAKYYNDVTFINEFFTQEFCNKYEYFDYKHYPSGEWKIESRDAKKIKRKLMNRHVNGGLPDVRIVDPNHRNKNYLLLQHYPDSYDDRNLYEPYARSVLTSIYALWGKEVMLATGSDEKRSVYVCVGTDPDKDVDIMPEVAYEKTWM